MFKHVIFLILLVGSRCQGSKESSEEESGASWIWPDQHSNMKNNTTQTHFRLSPDNVTVVRCVTVESTVGRCVPSYLCSSDRTIIRDGTGIIGIRSKTHTEPAIDSESIIKCKATKVCNGECTCCALHAAKPPPKAPPGNKAQREGCGWRNEFGVGFVIPLNSSDTAHYGEFPWMVAVFTLEPLEESDPTGAKYTVYAGGGSLIHPSVVLTAAHIVQPAWGTKPIRVRAGEWDLATKKEIYPYQQQDVVDVEVHKGFNEGNLHHDIALLFTAAFKMVVNVGVACLPPPRALPPRSEKCLALVLSWGSMVTLKKIDMPVVARDACQAQLRSTRLGDAFLLHSSFLCAGGEKDRDSCTGDGGSPLMCPIEGHKGRYMQSGIVAWGIGCGQQGTPGVYTDVAGLRRWIDNTVCSKGHDPSSYTF